MNRGKQQKKWGRVRRRNKVKLLPHWQQKKMKEEIEIREKEKRKYSIQFDAQLQYM